MAKIPLNEYTDPKTGEKVTKCLIPAELQKDIEASIAGHQGMMNQFMVYSQQLADLHRKWIDCRNKLDGTEGKIKETVQFACRKIGINPQDPWNYNIVEKVFEMRNPPIVMPISQNLLDGYETVTQPTEAK